VLVRKPPLYWGDGQPIDLGSLSTLTGRSLPTGVQTLGTPLAGAPPLQLQLLLRYERPWKSVNIFMQARCTHQSHSYSAIGLPGFDLAGQSTAYDLHAFSIAGASVGLRGARWRVELYGENLADARAQLYASSEQFYKAVTVNRPRTIGLHVSWDVNLDPDSPSQGPERAGTRTF
jgi:hypothetical protein